MAVSLVCLFALGAVPGPARAGHGRPCAGPQRAGARPPEPYTPDPGEAARMLAAMRARLRAAKTSPATSIVVPVWVHVLTEGRLGASEGAIAPQVEALNAAYGGRLGGVDTGIRFTLRGVTRTEEPTWFRDPLGNEAAMKTRLRKGGPETLNLYVAQPGDRVLGFSTYPHWYRRRPALDGVVIDWRTLPGGALLAFGKGYTGVHEIGHWLGLLHTFENGCSPPGDQVDDTPPEGQSTQGCPQDKDTCPDPGEDPIHNFMDYTTDACMSEFTAGQAVRMRDMWTAFRSPPV
ncbi:zinc metalloprotease [Sphaerisporangium aureirubrum]|uniref:Zinc metalloprotease n=1 Tax=Sphaerisporangium aureirubrum TaxID=1544736 RepID=A0ABW1NG07_9ACTN